MLVLEVAVSLLLLAVVLFALWAISQAVSSWTRQLISYDAKTGSISDRVKSVITAVLYAIVGMALMAWALTSCQQKDFDNIDDSYQYRL